MKYFARCLIAVLVLSAPATATPPRGICLLGYGPDAPADKLECFEFVKYAKEGAGIRFYLPNDQSSIITNYRFRNVLLYPDLKQNAPDALGNTLKTFETTAQQSPATRVFLNPWILKLREQSAQAAKQAADEAKLSRVTLADGRELVSFSLTKIENGVATIKHRDGVSKIPVGKLGDAQKSTLNATSSEWSLDTPFVAPKNAAGAFPRIVFKNGVLIKNATFKEVTDGILVFVSEGKTLTVSPDQFPGTIDLLGEVAAKTLSMSKSNPEPKEKVADSDIASPKNESMPAENFSDGSSLTQKSKDIEATVQKWVTTKDAEVAKLKAEFEAIDAEFQKAGGEAKFRELQKNAGPYVKFVVVRSMIEPEFAKLGHGDNVYEVRFAKDGAAGIIITPKEIASGATSNLFLSPHGTVNVTLRNGLGDKRNVFEEYQPAGGLELDAIFKNQRSASYKYEQAKSTIKSAQERAAIASAACKLAAQLIASIRVPHPLVSPSLAKRGWKASIQDKGINEVREALASGSLVRIALISQSYNADNLRSQFEMLDNFNPEETKPIPSPNEVKGIFKRLEAREFRVEFRLGSKNPFFGIHSPVCMQIPSSIGRLRTDENDQQPNGGNGAVPDFVIPGDSPGVMQGARCDFYLMHHDRDRAPDDQGYVLQIPVLSCGTIGFYDPEVGMEKKPNNQGERRVISVTEESLNDLVKGPYDDFQAGRISAQKKTEAMTRIERDYIARLMQWFNQH